LPALPFALQLLSGTVIGNPLAIECVNDRTLLTLLHVMEGVSTSKRIGTLAETALDQISELDGQLAWSVNSIRQATHAEKKEQSLKHREEVLRQLGFVQKDGKIKTTSQPMLAADLEEESQLSCIVCYEGYSFMPEELLGIYTFSKQVTLDLADSSSSPYYQHRNGYSTVTHFNVVHVQCHTAATEAERKMRVPKEEWEGATLRNSQTKCNNLFPILGPKSRLEAYEMQVDVYWANLQRVCKAIQPRFVLLSHDLKSLLLKYADEESFSEESRGGARESNIKFIPFLVQMGLFLLGEKGGYHRRAAEEALSAFLRKRPLDLPVVSPQGDGPHFFLVLALFLLAPAEWAALRPLLLDRLLIATKRLLCSDLSSQQPTLEQFRSPLIFFHLLDLLSPIFKPAGNGSAGSDAVGGSGHIDAGAAHTVSKPISHPHTEPWVEAMAAALRNNAPDVLDQMRDVLSTYESQLLKFESLTEFFDSLGLLSHALAKHPSVEEYITGL